MVWIDFAGLPSGDKIAVYAAIIAFSTFLGVIWQAYIARRHNHLSVRPLLDTTLYTQSQKVGLEIKNSGLGPALINSIYIHYKDFTYNLNKTESYQDFFKKSGLTNLIQFNPTILSFSEHSPTILESNKNNTLFMVELNQNSNNSNLNIIKSRLNTEAEHIIIEINYSTIYNKKHIIKLKVI
ncbi:hypothetical protein ACK1CN_25120 [Vibrio coralliilyticus]|uniref:hypothetical protein n=1 Tax=Vibrio coralliilyticus TaxID=190893 RepID=UPI00391731C3